MIFDLCQIFWISISDSLLFIYSFDYFLSCGSSFQLLYAG